MGLLDSIGSLAGGVIGNSRAAGDQQRANELAQAGYQKLLDMGAPPDTAKAIMLEQYKAAGTLTPELEQAINLGPSAAANVSEDPALRNAQMEALQQYQQAGQTGFTAQDQLNNQRMQNQIAADNQSRQASIIQGAQQRGESGSGASLAAQLLNGQASANNESQQGLQLAAQGNNARLAALGQSAGLGGQIRAQDFSNAQTKANAADQFQRFNVQNQQAIANQNVQSKNQAQAANLNNAQQLSNANVGNANKEALRQNQAQLDDWNNKLKLANAQAHALSGEAQQYQNQANATKSQASQFGQGVGGIAGQGEDMFTNMIGASGKGGSPSASSSQGGGYSGTTAGGAGDSVYSNDMSNSPFSSGTEMMAAHGGMITHDDDGMPCYSNGGMAQYTPDYGVSTNDNGGNAGGGLMGSPLMKILPMMFMGNGGAVPGSPEVSGDSYKNDKMHAMLSPGEVVIPNSITQSPDAAERAKEFIKGVLAGKQMRR